MEHSDTQFPSAQPASLGELMKGIVLAERYRVDGVLGEGGMALVFEGHHLGLDRPIAIKVLKPEFVASAQVIARFEQEARAVSRLEHNGIVKMFDVGTADVPGLLTPIAYLVMERLRGAELSDVLREGGPIPAPQALEWMDALLDAIGHAHAREVVHRDLKPENIFINESPEARVLKLVDFGIAKMVQPSGTAPLTQMGMIFGTPPYMSPEQATGQTVDARTDLYSAGIIFYEMLSGHVPFDSADMMDILRMHVQDEPPRLPVPDEVAEVLDRLLAKDPDDRFASAAEARAAVRAAKVSLEGPKPAQAPTMPIIAVEHPPPTAPAPRSAPPVRAIALAAAGALALGLIGWAVATRDPEAEPESKADEESKEEPAAVAAKPAAAMRLPFTKPTAPQEELAPIDEALDAGKRSEARALLAQLLERFPDDPDVLWRAAMAEGKQRAASQKRAEYMRDAIEEEPSRLEDKTVGALVLRELARPTVPDPLIELVVDHGDPIEAGWTKALLGRPKDALSQTQRTRLIEATEPSDTWNPRAHRCLDLWQAPNTAAPCTVYGEALDAMKAAPHASYRKSLQYAPVPTEPGSEEESEACDGLEEERASTLEAMADAKGDANYVPADFKTKANKKGGKRRRGPLGRLFGR